MIQQTIDDKNCRQHGNKDQLKGGDADIEPFEAREFPAADHEIAEKNQHREKGPESEGFAHVKEGFELVRN